ncbi:MAG TPA: AsmA-like C-terminal region-containing protein [Chitinophaga sp.]|uniref:AsmA-like C-terminal region-containing protein n=1 Tax=Chitinophaga sp. TaxID=1869181 RepID=UPI002D133828|nr:AsmA-like C-terminal region-containing protein [Chitinophaga sp.]HVI46177.1 AsmA-like C-terminal region-containing protein [Chitinophaga sp.]
MRKWLKIALITAGSIIGLIIILLLGMGWYIQSNKALFLKQLTARVNDNLNGELTIGDMKPSLFRSFPNMSIELRSVVLKDSLWTQHKHPLIDVSYIFVRVNTLSLLRKHTDVKEITLENGSIYLYTDTSGYSNTSIFRSDSTKHRKGTSKDAEINRLSMERITFVIDNRQKLKMFRLDIQQLDGRIQPTDSLIDLKIRSQIITKDFAFNTSKGSYLKNKTLGLDLALTFNKSTKLLNIPRQAIRIDNTPVDIAGQFSFAEKPPAFTLKINANKVLLQDAASWLSPNISSKLNTITLKGPLDAEAELNGHMKFRDTPHVVVRWKTENNTLVSAVGEWSDCSFAGRFNNQVLQGHGHTDENSSVNLFGLKASLGDVPIKADTIRVVNLKRPVLQGHFTSAFPLTAINDQTGDMPLLFKDGTAAADLNYEGPVLKDDNVPSAMYGTVQVQNGAFTYLPRNLSFHNCNALLRFTGPDLLLENIRIQSQKSSLQMDGKMKNILNSYFTAPDKIELSWNIRSPLVDLNEFRSFLSMRKKGKQAAAKQRAKMSRVSHQLENVLAGCNVQMQVLLDKVVFRHFTAQQVKAGLSLTATDLLLNKLSMLHAGGSAEVSGRVNPVGNDNTFNLNAVVSNMRIAQVFDAFDNFGMDGLTGRNLKGIISAKTNIRGIIQDDGTIRKHSLFGDIGFSLKNGALLDFEPLADIGNFIFRKRRLDSITFENLSSTFHVQGDKINIPPMRIASSAVNIDVNGVYGLSGGTNINMDIPLRNPAKDSAITDKQEKFRRSRKGIIVHLRAVSGKDGKVKIKLGKGD